ncbi:MAG: hypothetical protein DSM106950_00405 [Stigonema ocellatum SAG 48.90 = DSM 106950]|nr:hypothetical protein [Stigonema ocellatum SAG 48.90 = DSM 106950]
MSLEKIQLVEKRAIALNDEGCATAAGISYMEAQMWRDRFKPGVYKLRGATIEQVRFLESLKFSNDNN